jgi:uncharacterized protein
VFLDFVFFDFTPNSSYCFSSYLRKGFVMPPIFSRRRFLATAVTGAITTAVAGTTMLANPAKAALTMTDDFGGEPIAAPKRAGALPWSDLQAVKVSHSGKPALFSNSMKSLDGTTVTLDGFMMPYDDRDHQTEFLLTAYQAHCPFCMPGGMGSMVEIIADQGVAVHDKVMRLTGTLRLMPQDPAGILYKLSNARLIG